jgi:hypothetical protein
MRGRVSARSWKNALPNLTEDNDSVAGDGTRSADADFALPEVNALLNLASIKESLADMRTNTRIFTASKGVQETNAETHNGR